MTLSIGDDSSVKVAIRIRPQLAREQLEGSRVCTFVTPKEPQVTLGKDKVFTYDYVFDLYKTQNEIYDGSVSNLVDGCFDGFNATVIAYGQTGSGKTYTMGTGFEMNTKPEHEGMIPRALRHIFNGMDKKIQIAGEQNSMKPEFHISVQFMEIYNEEILDLLNTSGQQRKIKVHEDQYGNIVADGLEEAKSKSYEETLKLLQSGALNRTTASTKMNTQSSRSHAVFTLNISQTRSVEKDGKQDVESVCSKFHFVDLAGSERLKRTGATGDRAKEGISINCGLLALGNVISALGDKSKKVSHVPYRDSKITRLLQDSLGGNSRTVMIACISPSDSDFMETLNTLKYANRARNIKNKVTRNQDSTSKQMALLREQLQQTLAELAVYKAGLNPNINGGGDVATDVTSFNDMFQENTMLQEQIKKLKQRISELQVTIDLQKSRLVQLQMNNVNPSDEKTRNLIENYILQIEELNIRLAETEARVAKPPPNSARESFYFNSTYEVFEKARKALSSQRESIQSDSKSIMSEDEQEDADEIDRAIEDNEELKNLESKVNKRKEEIATISEQISLNEHLVVELENTMVNLESEMEHQRRMYENKLKILETKIKQAEHDRDAALSQSMLKDDSDNPKLKEMSEKINKYKQELKQLTEQNKENERRVRNDQEKQRQLNEVKQKLNDMKKQKVEMVKKMRDEAKNAREKEKEARKEIIQMKKTVRQTESLAQIQGTKIQSQDELLRRHKLEIINLKKKIKEDKNKDKKTSFGSYAGNLRSKVETKGQVVKIWKDIQHKMDAAIETKEKLQNIENELGRLLNERKKAEINNSDRNSDHLEYLSERIEDAQTKLCDLTDDEPIIQTSELSKGDLIYVFNQLLPFIINSQSQTNIEKRNLKKSLQKIRVERDQKEKEFETQKQIISHLINPTGSNDGKKGKRIFGRSKLINKAGVLGLDDDTSTLPDVFEPKPIASETKSIINPPKSTSSESSLRQTPSQKEEDSPDMPNARSNRSRFGNVWTRLTGSSTKDPKSCGKILPYVSIDEDGGTNLQCHSIVLGHRKPIVELFASIDGEHLFSSSNDKTIKIWNLASDKELGEITVSTMAHVIAYKNNLLYLGEANKLHVYDISISFEKELRIIQEMKNINFIKIDQHNRLYCVQERTIKCYEDLDDAKSLRFQSNVEITSIDVKVIDQSQIFIVYGCRDHCIRKVKHNFADSISSEVQIFDPPHLDTVTGIIQLDGYIFSVSRDYSMIKWDENGKKITQINNLHSDWITNLILMPVTQYLITNSRDGAVKVWDPYTLGCIASINQFKDPDGICSISANSTTLFTGAQTKNIKIWKLCNSLSVDGTSSPL